MPLFRRNDFYCISLIISRRQFWFSIGTEPPLNSHSTASRAAHTAAKRSENERVVAIECVCKLCIGTHLERRWSHTDHTKADCIECKSFVAFIVNIWREMLHNGLFAFAIIVTFSPGCRCWKRSSMEWIDRCTWRVNSERVGELLTNVAIIRFVDGRNSTVYIFPLHHWIVRIMN